MWSTNFAATNPGRINQYVANAAIVKTHIMNRSENRNRLFLFRVFTATSGFVVAKFLDCRNNNGLFENQLVSSRSENSLDQPNCNLTYQPKYLRNHGTDRRIAKTLQRTGYACQFAGPRDQKPALDHPHEYGSTP